MSSSSKYGTTGNPLLEQDHRLLPGILDDGIHLDVVPVVAERVLELGADALDAVEREGDEADDRDGPPVQLGDDGEGQDAVEEGEDLALVDAAVVVWLGIG